MYVETEGKKDLPWKLDDRCGIGLKFFVADLKHMELCNYTIMGCSGGGGGGCFEVRICQSLNGCWTMGNNKCFEHDGGRLNQSLLQSF